MVGQPASTVWAAMRRNTKNKKEKNGVQALHVAMLGILVPILQVCGKKHTDVSRCFKINECFLFLFLLINKFL